MYAYKTLIIYSTNFTVPVRKDIGCHEEEKINWNTSEKGLALLKKFNTLKLHWSLCKISLNLAKRAPPVSHSGLSCNTGREVPEGIKKALWVEISFNLGKTQLWKTLLKSFPEPRESHNPLWKHGEAFCLPSLKVHDSQNLILGETWFLFGSAGNSIKTQYLVEKGLFYAAVSFSHLWILTVVFAVCLYSQHNISF